MDVLGIKKDMTNAKLFYLLLFNKRYNWRVELKIKQLTIYNPALLDEIAHHSLLNYLLGDLTKGLWWVPSYQNPLTQSGVTTHYTSRVIRVRG